MPLGEITGCQECELLGMVSSENEIFSICRNVFRKGKYSTFHATLRHKNIHLRLHIFCSMLHRRYCSSKKETMKNS